MSKSPVFLTMEQVLAVHARVVARYGGDPAVRDQGLLESAIAMPPAQFGGEFLHPDLPAMAAAYLFHLCRNHPFADGNKRTALAAAEVFLLANGYRFTATNPKLAALTLGVAEGTLTKADVTSFIREHIAGAR